MATKRNRTKTPVSSTASPKRSTKRIKRAVGITLPRELHAKLHALAVMEGRTVSNAIQHLVELGLPLMEAKSKAKRTKRAPEPPAERPAEPPGTTT